MPSTTAGAPAVEVNIITFNLWGKKVNNLSMTEIKDLKMGKTYDLDAKWKIYSEHEASEFYASIAYISQIRTIDGRILQPNPNDIVKVAKSISSEFTQSDLIIDRDKK